MSAPSAYADHDVTTRDRVLRLIVERGPVTATQIAAELELTPAAVRRHFDQLEENRQIVVHEATGPTHRRRGRPARHYVATDAGRSGLSDAYSDLATHALEYLVEVAGPQALSRFAEDRRTELTRRYRGVVDGAGEDRAARAQALADALSSDGYAATVRTIGPTGMAVQLCQGNCPVQEVAEAFPQLCEAETQAFSALLDVHVQRLATLAGGGHACTTNIPVSTPVPHRPTA